MNNSYEVFSRKKKKRRKFAVPAVDDFAIIAIYTNFTPLGRYIQTVGEYFLEAIKFVLITNRSNLDYLIKGK